MGNYFGNLPSWAQDALGAGTAALDSATGSSTASSVWDSVQGAVTDGGAYVYGTAEQIYDAAPSPLDDLVDGGKTVVMGGAVVLLGLAFLAFAASRS